MTNMQYAQSVRDEIDALIAELANPDAFPSMSYQDRRGISSGMHVIRKGCDSLVERLALTTDGDETLIEATDPQRPVDPTWVLEMVNTKTGDPYSRAFDTEDEGDKYLKDALSDGGWKVVSFGRVN